MVRATLTTCLLALLVGGPLVAQPVPAGPTRAPAGATLAGLVYDSLAGAPLAGARVELVNADSVSSPPRIGVADERGRYQIDGVTPGRYLIGFLHPLLDSLGLEASPRQLTVPDSRSQRADLALPSPATVRVALCGPGALTDSAGVIVGFVRRARTEAGAAAAVVTVQWADLFLGRGGFTREQARRDAVSSESGWFALCGAPVGGTLAVSAAQHADSTALIELDMPSSGFLRRDLYLGEARVVAARRPVTSAEDSLQPPVGPLLGGTGRLRGVVVAAASGRPLQGARVRIADGAEEARTDDTGAFLLAGIPTGTRMLQVRAVAQYPVTMPVDVTESAPPLRIAMQTVRAVLDTVRITARRVGRNTLLEFMDRRRRAGTGRFLTSEDIAKLGSIFTGDLFRMMPGMSVDASGMDSRLTMRGGAFGRCQPAIFLDNMRLVDIGLNELNSMVRPNDIIGIEAYPAMGAPGQFFDPRGCGSVVIWTR
jgi:hypothetical protein